jgi:hypothetical protein
MADQKSGSTPEKFSLLRDKESSVKNYEAARRVKKEATPFVNYSGHKYLPEEMRKMAAEDLARAGGHYEKGEAWKVIKSLKNDLKERLIDNKTKRDHGWVKDTEDIKRRIKYWENNLQN